MVNLAGADDWSGEDETGYRNPDLHDPEDTSDFAPEEADAEADPEAAGVADPDDAGTEEIEPAFADVIGWVEGFFLPVIRRQITAQAGSGLSWDERWWLYPEVVARLTALHYAWEEARASDKPSAMSSWWIHHLEPHLRVIFDSESGPMANADADGTFSGWPALPGQPVPSELYAVIAPSED
ncbi:DUF4913 domain-containing protein [Rhodococcus sp. NPDC058481]|uniref:DUF4913 domain-containing protein n=1 Tax=unclassified Rhodococcus (in: high G+C Gram-positive bacteria) TaxID=192944 RepID=UPI00364A5045